MDKPQLPSGYILMEQKGNIVLAFCPDYERDRYATWYIDEHGLTRDGEYFGNPKSAAINFEMRAVPEPEVINLTLKGVDHSKALIRCPRCGRVGMVYHYPDGSMCIDHRLERKNGYWHSVDYCYIPEVRV